MLIVPGESKKFGEHIALLLDRMNDLEKARLMGRIATAFLQEKITIDGLKSLNFALDQLDLRMLPTLRSIYSERFGSGDDPKLRPLANAGLLDTRLHVETDTLTLETANLNGFSSESTRYESLKAASIIYERNDLGRLFVDTCLR